MRFSTICLLSVLLVVFSGCAVSPEDQERNAEREARIAQILSQHSDDPDLGKLERCISERNYQSFRALDDRRILFEGREDKLWINTLRARCPDMQHGTMLRTRSFSSGRMCDADTFQVVDWFDWPWYRRMPWRWGTEWGSGVTCSLGKFQPVTQLQVDEIRAVLKSK